MSQDTSVAGSSSAKMPSVMRFERVQSVLNGDPSLRDLLGPKDQALEKRNKQKHYCSRGAIVVTLALQAKGIDPHSANRDLIKALAMSLLPEKGVKATPKPVKKPEEAKVEKPKVEKPKVEKPKVEKPKVEKPKVEKPKVEKSKVDTAHVSVTKKTKPEPVAAAVAVAAVATVPAVAAPMSSASIVGPVAAAVATAVPAVSAAAVENLGSDTPPAFVYHIYASALSMAVTLAKLLELGDRLPGAEQRQENANRVIDDLLPLRDTPVPMPQDLMPVTMQNVKAASSKA